MQLAGVHVATFGGLQFMPGEGRVGVGVGVGQTGTTSPIDPVALLRQAYLLVVVEKRID